MTNDFAIVDDGRRKKAFEVEPNAFGRGPLLIFIKRWRMEIRTHCGPAGRVVSEVERGA